jgi:hypothetical protein
MFTMLWLLRISLGACGLSLTADVVITDVGTCIAKNSNAQAVPGANWAKGFDTKHLYD